MNANELADGLDEDGYHHCADMLRQQQAEIEVNKYGYELDINIKIEELKEKDSEETTEEEEDNEKSVSKLDISQESEENPEFSEEEAGLTVGE